MKTKTFIVTGANTGIGKAIALSLAKQKHHVVIISRDGSKGEIALDEIRRDSENPTANLMVGNLGSIESTKNLAGRLLAEYPGISVLINNAGIWPLELRLNADGLESAFMVNHLAPYILGAMLLGRLRENAPARVVNVNAGLYFKGKIDLGRTPYGKDFGRFSTYMNTKLCNIYFTQKFAQITEGTGVTANAVHPGVIRTGLGDTGGFTGWLLRQVKRGWDAPEEGARPPVWLATAGELGTTSGRYFQLKTETPYAPSAQSAEIREGLWDLDRKLTGM